ncbi:TetR/AcrR family transcriptional regulator [Streptomyces lavenduligriseus]|uniref:TetR/AcrR family transcriptional regulator n=1 Tax=Streptomyces lavenduligriseus TaxID=67315 RepID=A0ABT0P2A5_9ACTN|nr:TetR/AcrR family transcriptional regulator [Streptomyces lavenduligriseus]MCL3997716.1 TetR/AcrR family transcriptional regulator [Streptomyces lavenduligriseus]
MPKSAAGPAPRPMRADARRGYDRIVAAAESLVAEHGAEASLDEIARHAGVGSATLHRRFPSRQLLLEAVFKGRVEALCAKAHGLLSAPDPGAALVTWFRAVGAHAVANEQFVAGAGDHCVAGGCSRLWVAVACDRARRMKAVRPDVTITQLLKLVSAIALATEEEPDGPAEADRLLDLAIDGARAR